MPDVAMCKGQDCPRALNCYRFTAKPSEFRQSYFVKAPIKADGTCDYMYPNMEIPRAVMDDAEL
jgi:hypothetical protein